MFPTYTIRPDFADDVDQSHPYAATGFADEPPVPLCEFDRADLMAELAQWDRTHCGECGAESSGTTLAGVAVPLCDRCLTFATMRTVGVDLIRDLALNQHVTPPMELALASLAHLARESSPVMVRVAANAALDAVGAAPLVPMY